MVCRSGRRHGADHWCHERTTRDEDRARRAPAVRCRSWRTCRRSEGGGDGQGRPVAVTTVVVPDPGPGEALVRVQACGVCHTDLHYREGGINDDFPFLLGHEAAGVVEAVGAGRHLGRTRRLRRPQLAGRLRRVPVVPAWPALVLLRHPQRHPADDPGATARRSPPRSASAPSPRRRWWQPVSAPRSIRRPGPRLSACSGAG